MNFQNRITKRKSIILAEAASSVTNFNRHSLCACYSSTNCETKKISLMAEIHVQPKRKTTPAWLWIVLALLVLGAIAYFLLRNKKTDAVNQPNTSLLQPQEPPMALPYT